MPDLQDYPTASAVPGVDRVLILDDGGVAVLDPQDLSEDEVARYHVLAVDAQGVGKRIPLSAFGLGQAPRRDPLALSVTRAPSGTLTAGEPFTLTMRPSGGLGPYVCRTYAGNPGDGGSLFGGDRSIPTGGTEAVRIAARPGSVDYYVRITDSLGVTVQVGPETVTTESGASPPDAPTGLVYTDASPPGAPTGLTYQP